MTSSQRLKTPLIKHNETAGFLVVDKPAGISSFGVVKKVRAITGVKKVGHAGTLDPFASGVLIVALGKAYTTQINMIHQYTKQYTAVMVLGTETDTLDLTGKITRKVDHTPDLSKSQLARISQQFRGKMSQLPPAFSAKKVNGQRAYQLARQGIQPVLSEKEVTISQLSMQIVQDSGPPMIKLSLTCSTGTYVRALVRDIAQEMGTVGYTQSLIRTAIGPYVLADAVALDSMTDAVIQAQLIR